MYIKENNRLKLQPKKIYFLSHINLYVNSNSEILKARLHSKREEATHETYSDGVSGSHPTEISCLYLQVLTEIK